MDEKSADLLTLDIYPSAKSSYTLFEDDGKSDDYKHGKFTQTRFACETTATDTSIEIAAARGDYDGKLARRTYILKINHKAAISAQVARNGAPLPKLESRAALDSADQGWFNDIAAATVWVKFPTATSDASKVVLNGLDPTQ